ncbi:hypothetical protein [Marinobacter sp.]|uniref:hypothetical protein n=1 Tax=Marinobacter sp. TaxID=50741 RepID=UPI0019ECE615|nr:hypothetical protein [Marinobacter sp.]MBE0484762.1 hypothetical protein [Marinobacter sp.]
MSIRARLQASLLPVLLLAATAPVAANDLDVTMRMVEDTEDLTSAVAREIRLPELPGLAPEGKPGRGADAPARERGREFGQSASERARDARNSKPGVVIDGLPEAARDARERQPERPSRP